MAAEQQSNINDFRLEEFRVEPLFYVISRFDSYHDFLCRAGSYLLTSPGRNYSASFQSAEEPVLNAFDRLVDTVMPDYDLGLPEERVYMLAMIKVGAEKARSRHFSAAAGETAPYDKSVDHTRDVEAETAKYVGPDAGYLTDIRIASKMKDDFAAKLAEDSAAFCTEESRLIRLNTQRQLAKQETFIRVFAGFATAALLGTAAYAAWQSSRPQPE